MEASARYSCTIAPLPACGRAPADAAPRVRACRLAGAGPAGRLPGGSSRTPHSSAPARPCRALSFGPLRTCCRSSGQRTARRAFLSHCALPACGPIATLRAPPAQRQPERASFIGCRIQPAGPARNGPFRLGPDRYNSAGPARHGPAWPRPSPVRLFSAHHGPLDPVRSSLPARPGPLGLTQLQPTGLAKGATAKVRTGPPRPGPARQARPDLVAPPGLAPQAQPENAIRVPERTGPSRPRPNL